ncbi:MAG: vWA domain-containing protein, partial [Pseudonocardiaceae bacterium]
MPDFSALGAKRNVDTLDHRALGYTYDTMGVVGIGLDRTGSMLALTPDPMTTGAPDITKWEAATRGVSAFLQDCEAVYDSAVTYVAAGVKTFRTTDAGNDFTPIFPGTPFGLVRSGGAYSRGVFDSTVAGLTPDGTTPLADALQDVQDTLVEPPFGGLPADEQRYLAMLTDGLQTSGSPMASIPDGSLTNTVVFGMGFGTGAEVDYATVAAMVAKGRTLATAQVFNGANAGTIDKFYSNALASAIGFTTVSDPVLELFAGEHVHLDFDATSAEDALLFTVQGMDYVDENWSFHLTGPDGHTAYLDGVGHRHAVAVGHGDRRPHVTAKRSTGRLSLVMQRDSAPSSAWVGTWRLMAAYRAKDLDAMIMPDIGELLFPVSAGPTRGPRFARLLVEPEARQAVRSIVGTPAHRLDVPSVSTNRSDRQACNLVVNIYARTRLRVGLAPRTGKRVVGERLALDVSTDVLAGSADLTRGLARMVAPAHDLRGRMARLEPSELPRSARLEGSQALRFDPAQVLAALEREEPDLARQRDE